jgi:hypothetical protein
VSDIAGAQDALAVAETELDELSKQVQAAFRQYKKLDIEQTLKAAEVRELRRQIHAEQQR